MGTHSIIECTIITLFFLCCYRCQISSRASLNLQILLDVIKSMLFILKVCLLLLLLLVVVVVVVVVASSSSSSSIYYYY